ncbi:PLP-dependent aminotransferase family protein [Sphingosinicella sp. CPCC 101087]|uniref:aminotransferase-like domain-containing protein n=1 Tax=Sphingosinicella sp. CPCC 101087 TaxID=2497754 RepID=UPI0013EB34A8|nr:PLP-dependent aminotransferase family protein [Sphingosinicella sp. CPCC 101087]
MIENRFARRAATLSTAFPAPHFPSELGPEVIPFDSGFAAPQLLPDLTAFAHAALTEHREETLQYSATQGQPELRGWLADLMNEDGCSLGPDNLLIVNGAKHGLELVCRLLLDEGDAVVVTAPTYFTAIPIFRSFGVEFVEVGQDEDGLLTEALEHALAERQAEGRPLPKLIYNVADFHNPTGATMSEQRRLRLIEIAEREGIFVVEDTPYRRVRFEGPTIASLKALDPGGIVIHLGTFSKLIAPGLRIGWVAAESELIARLIQLKSDGGSSPLMQRIIYEFGRSPAFAAHVERVQAVYRERRDRMVAAVRRRLPEAQLSVPEGGYYVWLTLPPHIDGDALAARAAQAGVNIIAGSKFFAGGEAYPANRTRPNHHVRLSYSYATPEQIDEGVERLAAIYAPLAA